MSGSGDDVSELFKSFGADKSQYKELTRTSDALGAQARWPLFNGVLAEERETPPLLSRQEKSRWSSEQPASARAARDVPASGEDDKMARSLGQLTRRAPDRAPAVAVAAAASTTASTAMRGASAPENAVFRDLQRTPSAMPAKASPIRNFMFERPAIAEQPLQKNTRVPGLFPKSETVTATEHQLEVAGADSNDLLSSIFKRLEGKNEVPPATKKPAFLRNIDRR